MSTPPCRTSSDRASAWACAAMERKPCGPPSERHQISGPPAPSRRVRLRRIVRPASAKCAGRSAGRSDRLPLTKRADDDRGRRDRSLPATRARGRRRRAPSDRNADQWSTPVVEDEHQALVAVALPRWSQRGVDDRRGGVDGAREQSPGARAERMTGRVRLESGVQAELGDEAVVVGRELAVEPGREGVGGELPLQQGCRVGPPARALANQGNAQAATSWPAASAMTWLLADEPRLSERGQVLLVPADLAQRESLCSNRSATSGQSSSSRRIQVQLISRRPISIPLVQCTPDRNGFAATRRSAGRRRARRSASSWVSYQAAASTVRWWWRDSSQTCLTFPVSASSRWWSRNAYCAGSDRRPVVGSRNQSGGACRSGRRRAPPACRPGSRRRSAITRLAGLVRYGARGVRRERRTEGRLLAQRQANLPRPARAGPVGRPRQSGVRGRGCARSARWRTSGAGGGRTSPGADGSSGPLNGLRAAAREAAVDREGRAGGGDERVERDRHRAAGPHRGDERVQLAAGPCPAAGLARRPACRPVHTVARWKLSSRPLRPPPVTSSVSFGKRALPP